MRYSTEVLFELEEVVLFVEADIIFFGVMLR